MLKAVPYEGIYDLCDELYKQGIKMAAATYKREDYALMLLKEFGFHKYFSVMHGADNENILKKSDIIDLCITELNCNRNECVLAGDTEYDAIGAQKAGIGFIAVTYGFGFQSERDTRRYRTAGVVEKPMEILKYLSS